MNTNSGQPASETAGSKYYLHGDDGSRFTFTGCKKISVLRSYVACNGTPGVVYTLFRAQKKGDRSVGYLFHDGDQLAYLSRFALRGGGVYTVDEFGRLVYSWDDHMEIKDFVSPSGATENRLYAFFVNDMYETSVCNFFKSIDRLIW